MGVVTRKDSPYYWLTLERPGQRPLRCATRILVRASSVPQTRENRRLAELEYHARMADLARGRLDLPAARPGVTLTAFLPRYAAWLERERPRSAGETLRRLENTFAALGPLPLAAVTPAVVETWQRTRGGVSPQTIARDLSDLRGLLRQAVDWHVIPVSPLATLRMRRTPSRQVVRYLTPDEHTRLMAALQARDDQKRAARARLNAHREARGRALLPASVHFADWLTPAVLLSLHTGIRRGEMRLLTWDAIDWRAKVLVVEAHTAKTNRTRRIPLNGIALDAIEKWRSESGHRSRGLVFPGQDGRRPMAHGSSKAWTDIVRAAGLRRFRWHDLRHTFASWLVQRGVSLYQVRDLMGHSTITLTERYAHLAPADGHAAVAKLESIHGPYTERP